MREVLIIDGYNFLKVIQGQKDVDKAQFEEDRQKLLSQLASYGGTASTELIIVFDGRSADAPGTDWEKKAGITIAYSAVKESADDVIERMAVKKLADGAFVTVVTSDAELQRTVFRQGINRMSAREFAGELAESSAVNRTARVKKRHDPLENRLSPQTRRALEDLRIGKINAPEDDTEIVSRTQVDPEIKSRLEDEDPD